MRYFKSNDYIYFRGYNTGGIIVAKVLDTTYYGEGQNVKYYVINRGILNRAVWNDDIKRLHLIEQGKRHEL